MNKTIPAISIIIPMYNTEKYVSECLDSILAQTFDDYEVIIVDDCSTDSSCHIVEEYIPKFTKNGTERLRLVRSKVNSGGAGAPRNIGLSLSRGEYVFFMDSDDAITQTAMEELYSVAQKFPADFLHCEKFYHVPNAPFTTDKKFFSISSGEKVEFVTEPTVISQDLAVRVRDYTNRRFYNRLPLGSNNRRAFSFCFFEQQKGT